MESAKIHREVTQPTLCLRGALLSFQQPRVMGIINVNDDSFYQGSRVMDVGAALRLAEKHMAEGASMLDIGASSSRPGAGLSEPHEEWNRIAPVLKAVRTAFPEAWLSVDTYHALVARHALDAGTDLINDISGGAFDLEMLPFIMREQVPYILMHMRGTPATMQTLTDYGDLVPDVILELAGKVSLLREGGHTNLVIDPGFGFAKSLEQNYRLLHELEALRVFRAPVLAGVSRKSMVTRVLGVQPDEALNGTTALHMLLLQKGVDILRVHDVKAASEAIRIHTFAKEALA